MFSRDFNRFLCKYFNVSLAVFDYDLSLFHIELFHQSQHGAELHRLTQLRKEAETSFLAERKQWQKQVWLLGSIG
jgi:hypothetical protein